MIPRKPLIPNKQTLSPVLGSQWFARYPKTNESPSIKAFNGYGRPSQGESFGGGPIRHSGRGTRGL